MRKRLFLFGSLLAAVVLGGYLVLSTQRHAINAHAFAEIHVHMSEAEIERIFGAPGRPSSGLGLGTGSACMLDLEQRYPAKEWRSKTASSASAFQKTAKLSGNPASFSTSSTRSRRSSSLTAAKLRRRSPNCAVGSVSSADAKGKTHDDYERHCLWPFVSLWRVVFSVY
jgi:hypothetical protein